MTDKRRHQEITKRRKRRNKNRNSTSDESSENNGGADFQEGQIPDGDNPQDSKSDSKQPSEPETSSTGNKSDKENENPGKPFEKWVKKNWGSIKNAVNSVLNNHDSASLSQAAGVVASHPELPGAVIDCSEQWISLEPTGSPPTTPAFTLVKKGTKCSKFGTCDFVDDPYSANHFIECKVTPANEADITARSHDLWNEAMSHGRNVWVIVCRDYALSLVGTGITPNKLLVAYINNIFSAPISCPTGAIPKGPSRSKKITIRSSSIPIDIDVYA